MRILLFFIVPLVLSGCASKLIASREDGTRIPGVPVGTPELVKITSITSYKPVKSTQFEEYCTPEINSSVQFLPLGEVTYLNMDPSTIAKGEFTLEFTDSGNLKKVSLNSDASSGVESVNTLANTLLPFLATTKAAESPGSTESVGSALAPTADSLPTAKELKAKHCLLEGTTVSGIEKIDVN